MTYENEKIINCSEFEGILTDYLDNNLDRETHRAVAAHALRCPLCHGLLNEVKDALALCREISAPKTSITKLEARIISMTAPETAMACQDFENHLTDYLDGFLPAPVFSSLGTPRCFVRAMHGFARRGRALDCRLLHLQNGRLADAREFAPKILQATIGTTEAKAIKPSWTAQAMEWMRGLSFPIPIPQLAPVAMITIFAVLIFGQSVSADNSIGGIYEKSIEMAGQTYQQGADIMLGEKPIEPKSKQEPIRGIYVNSEGK